MGWTLEPKQAETATKFHKEWFGVQPLFLMFWFWLMISALAASLAFGIVGGVFAVRLWLIVTALVNLIYSGLFTELEFAKISPGASDNASAVAVMLDLARRFRAKPVRNCEIWFLGDGSEETYMNGMAKFLDDRRPLLDKNLTYIFVPETCGQARPRIIVGEGVGTIHYHDPALVGTLFLATRRLGHHDVTPIVLRTGGTDLTPPTVRGYAAAGIVCLNENDFPPNYHAPTDLPENCDPATVRKVTDIFEEAIRIVDAEF
jgi:Zn-dependent M28 family amino/carboxypeptidase